MPDVFTLTEAGIGYDRRRVFEALSLRIPAGQVTAFCGPNGCGKSTALKAMRGMLPVLSGQALLLDRPVSAWGAKGMAREVAMLSQHPQAPEEMTVRDLVALGRYAHRKALGGLGAEDRAAIAGALAATRLQELADRRIAELSGGQMQRAWLAMVVAQAAPAVLLDEPTNHLDISHALSTLAFVRRLARDEGKTVVVVLHDLNLAAAYADRIVLFRDGVIAAEGPVPEVCRPEILDRVFDIRCQVIPRPDGSGPLIVPLESTAH